MGYSPPGSSVHGILQAKILEWVAMPSSRVSSDSGIKSGSPALQAGSLPSEPQGKPQRMMQASQKDFEANFKEFPTVK